MSEKKDKIPVLNPDYDLSVDSDLELAQTMKRLCSEYEMCYYTISTAICEVWDCIVRVAEEIVRRGGCERRGEKEGEVRNRMTEPLDLDAIADEIVRVIYPTYEQAIPGIRNAIIQKKQRIRQILEYHIKSSEEKEND